MGPCIYESFFIHLRMLLTLRLCGKKHSTDQQLGVWCSCLLKSIPSLIAFVKRFFSKSPIPPNGMIVTGPVFVMREGKN